MVQRGDDFVEYLKNLSRDARSMELPEDMILKAWLDTQDTVTLTDHDPEIEERALGTQTYLCVRPNEVSNPDFESDLTGWTETIDASITGSTSHETGQGLVFAQQASIGALKLDMADGDSNNDVIERYQDIAASAGEIWNAECYAYVTGLSAGAQFRMRGAFLDAGLSSLGAFNQTITAVNSAYTLVKAENQTAPASTAWLRLRLQIQVNSGPDQTGTVYVGKVRAEKGATTMSLRERRMICGEWVCRT